MPQMKPMMWTIIMTMTLFMIIMMIIMNYFTILEISQKSKFKKTNLIKWKW